MQNTRMADRLVRQGLIPKALALYKKILRTNPDDEHAAKRVAELAGVAGKKQQTQSQGQSASRKGTRKEGDVGATRGPRRVRSNAHAESDSSTRVRTTGPDPRKSVNVEESLARASAEFERTNHEGAREVLQQLLQQIPEARTQILQMADAQRDVNVAFHCVEVVAADLAAREEWDLAMSTLRSFVECRPAHIPAILKLIDVSVDAGLDEVMVAAQIKLADAYLATGAGPQARVIAEDLVIREPWNVGNIERFRQALTLEGETNPDRVIADCLSRPSPFGAVAQSNRRAASGQPASRIGTRQPNTDPQFALSLNAIDVNAVLRGDDSEGLSIVGLDQVEVVEVDLSDAIGKLHSAAPHPGGGTGTLSQNPDGSDGAFDDFRREVTLEDTAEAAEQHFKLGLTYRELGMTAEAIQALEIAARSSRHLFRAASLIGRMYTEQGRLGQAIEWLERAAEAPATSIEDGRRLLYELGRTLEANDEAARALAVYLELQADADDYRDVGPRVERLSKLQAKG